ncbi:hypothetical protein SAZ_20525 [Streptomyces noursei ZPM]|nr:hypothetical protein SAZ_20525 [Streptomyces noursei ZPM]
MLLAVLAAVPVLVGVAVRIQAGRSGGGDGRGPAFLTAVTGNGLFLVFTALAVTLPVFLPMAVGVRGGPGGAADAGGTPRPGPGRPDGRSGGRARHRHAVTSRVVNRAQAAEPNTAA